MTITAKVSATSSVSSNCAATRCVDLVWHVCVGDTRHRFGPLECRAFAIREERRFAPRIQRVDALFRLAGEARVLRVHVDAIGTAVDLRGADLDELEQRPLECRLAPRSRG